MGKKTVSGIMLTLLLISMLTLALNVQQVKAGGTIYIRGDGSVEGTTYIQTADSVTYVFTTNVNDFIVVERNNIRIDGNGYMLRGDAGYGVGMYLFGLFNVTVQNINIRDFNCGICLDSSAFVAISSSNVSVGISDTAISLINSSRNIISENRITGGPGISIDSSSNNSIHGNIFEAYENMFKIWVSQSSNNNEIYQNKVVIGDVGIVVKGSDNRVWGNEILGMAAVILSGSNNVVSGNKMGGIRVSGFNNTVDGNDVWWLVEIQGVNHTFSRNKAALVYGLSLEGFNHIVAGNDIEGYGGPGYLRFEAAFGCAVSGNRIRYADRGIFISSSSNNVISGNIITDNIIGIEVNSGATNNFVLHNNFVANRQQVLVTASGTANIWDDGYPSGGNYWSDYMGVDIKSGPNQGQPGSDDIGDTPYIIDTDNLDHYPLMKPWIGIVTATLDIEPDSLNLRSRLLWITAYIELPAPYSPRDIDVSTIRLNGVVQAGLSPIAIGDYDGDGILDLMVKFKGANVMPLLHVGINRLTVTGKVNSILFEGIDTIRMKA